MSEQIREQISAFLDGELPASESELLLKRLTRDAELREGFGRYGLIGEAMRGSGAAPATLTRGFAARVNRAIDGEPGVLLVGNTAPGRSPRWWRPIAGAAVAAGVAAVAVVALQQRAYRPAAVAVVPAAPHVVLAAVKNGSGEALSYTVPATFSAAPAALPEARLTNYVFAHSNYSSLLGQRNVLSGLIAEPPDPSPPVQAVNAP